MPDSDAKRLEPDEMLRVMDAAQVIRARRESMDMAAFDRDATIREIQVMYEDLGDIVESDVIARALDEYMQERSAFAPTPKSFARTLAWAYVRRSMLARRVLLPVMVLGGLAWSGATVSASWERRALARETQELLSDIASLRSAYDVASFTLDDLRSSQGVQALAADGAEAFRAGTAAAESRLASVETILTDFAGPDAIPDSPTRELVRQLSRRVDGASVLVFDAERELAEALLPLQTLQRRERLTSQVPTVLAAIREVASEPGVAAAQAEVAATAMRQAAASDVRGLEQSVVQLRRTLAVLEQAYRVEILGGVWRYPDDNRSVRNYYLRVRALDDRGNVVAVSVRNEENQRTELVREWGERVPKEVYDRVGADKEDNGIIDEAAFGAKRRGWLTMDRSYPDVGQITRWDDA